MTAGLLYSFLFQNIVDIMRRRFAKKKRREILRAGKEILEEGWLTDIGCDRKSTGYGIRFIHNGWIYNCSGDDELDAYRVALMCIHEDADIPFPQRQ